MTIPDHARQRWSEGNRRIRRRIGWYEGDRRSVMRARSARLRWAWDAGGWV